MPTYIYKFTETGETIEVQQAFSDESLTEAVHPATGATMPVKKVFTPVGVTFRGGGFYKTDSRGGKSSSSSGSSSDSSSTASGDGSSSSSDKAASSSSDKAASTPSTAGSTPAPAAKPAS